MFYNYFTRFLLLSHIESYLWTHSCLCAALYVYQQVIADDKLHWTMLVINYKIFIEISAGHCSQFADHRSTQTVNNYCWSIVNFHFLYYYDIWLYPPLVSFFFHHQIIRIAYFFIHRLTFRKRMLNELFPSRTKHLNYA